MKTQQGLGRLADAELIARSLADGRWFEPLFDRHYVAIHRFLCVRAGLDAADDLASETFTIAFRRRGSYDLSCLNAAPWLYGIAVNLLHAHGRREHTRRRTVEQIVAGVGDRAAEAVEVFDRNGELSLALRGLSECDRDLIVLFAWAELSYEQLAAVLQLPVGTVRSRLSRVRAWLRANLDSVARVKQMVEGRAEG